MQKLLREIRACKVCEEHLALGPRPIVRADPSARLLIIGQAPGTKVHASGIPWDDASGNRLREWMGIDKAGFYAPEVAIVPMGLCYPGKGKSGDLPPRPECAPLWHKALLEKMPIIELTLLIGTYAQNQYLADPEPTLTATVRNYARWLPGYLPLPHPSPRNNIWLRKNPWFEAEVLSMLKARVEELKL